jgi:hypothetical protein
MKMAYNFNDMINVILKYFLLFQREIKEDTERKCKWRMCNKMRDKANCIRGKACQDGYKTRPKYI